MLLKDIKDVWESIECSTTKQTHQSGNKKSLRLFLVRTVSSQDIERISNY